VKEGANPEMEGLRKLVSGRLRAQAAELHPDPDVLTAFAENALLESERAQLLRHLGACKDCRDILFLAAPDPAEAQKALSCQPKRSSGLVLRWGALAASLVIVGTAVIVNRPMLRRATEPEVAKAPLSAYVNKAEEKAPAEVESTRDRYAPAPPPTAKERPARKHMTAKPQASMEFDDSEQVHVSLGALAKLEKQSPNDELAMEGRHALRLQAPATSQTLPASHGSAGAAAKDKSDGRVDYAYASRSAGERAATANSHGRIRGTISDLLGAVVGNAKITVSGPAGSETANSDPQGRFAFNSLTPGVYSVKAEANGFKSADVEQVAVLDNKSATIGVRLEPGKASETVEVTAAAAGVNETAAAAPPIDAKNGFSLAQKQVLQNELQKAMATNSPQRVKSSAPRWTISPDGAVQESLDEGKTWQNVKAADGRVFRALSVAGSHIWAGGSSGMLYHSADSGQSWAQVVPTSADQKLSTDITHIEFSDPLNGSVSTVNGQVWSTSDGGNSWRRK
jgi:Carboxypeptidase regulatory-like domain/Photosynthesis system II assembly factor YCF48